MTGIKILPLLCAATLASWALASPAQSQTVPTTVGAKAPAGSYSFSFGNGVDFAAGTITTDMNGHAVSIYGVVDGTDPITGLSTYASADNDLYSTGAWVTFAGVSFSSLSLGDFNFYNSGLGYYGLLSSRADINGYPDGRVAMAGVAAVPEPGTWTMMILGLAAGGVSIRRQRRSISYIPQLA